MSGPRTLPIDLVQAAAAFATRLGWDVDPLLAQAGVSPMLLAEGRARVTEDQVVRLIQEMWRRTDDELFGLGRYPLPRGTFRLVCYAVLGAADLEEALHRLEGFLRAVPAMPVEIAQGEDATVIRLRGARGGSNRMLPSLVSLVAAHRLASWLLRRNVELLGVEMAYPAPQNPEVSAFAFDIPPRFGAAQTQLMFANRWLKAPLMRSEDDLEEMLRQSPRALLRRPRYDTSDTAQVRRMIERDLRSGESPDARAIADRLAISQQTLRRRLAEEGTSVRRLSNDVRRDVAVASLVQGRERIADLALRLGYSEPSAFTRAFRGWTGSSPSEYRNLPDR